MAEERTQLIVYTILKKMNVVNMLTFVVYTQLYNIIKNIQLVTRQKYLNLQKYDKTWYGFIKCTVLAPKRLYHPVLPQRIKVENYEKLIFTLCKTCTETRNPNTCSHDNQ